jgi:hypothetical protein
VIRFSQSEEASTGLQERLQQEQAGYVLRLIEEAFQWEKLLSVFRIHYDRYGNSLVPVNDLSAAWAKQILGRLEEESVVCEKFGKQLTSLLAGAKEDGYTTLQPRIEAACNYFIKVIDLLMASVEKHKPGSKKTTWARKYAKELAGLEKTLHFKKDQLDQALRMGEGLAKGMDVNSLFDITRPPQPVLRLKTEKTTGKLKKGETQRISLDLFKENKTVSEIARLRGLAVMTVENHLAAFVRTGEIEIHELVPEEKIAKIVEAVRETGERFPGLVKNILGESFSYLEIKAVMNSMEKALI